MGGYGTHSVPVWVKTLAALFTCVLSNSLLFHYFCQKSTYMQKVQVKAEVDLKSFLSQLGNQELEAFMREIRSLLSRRKAKDSHAKEKALLLRLNEECSLPESHWERFHFLNEKKEVNSLSPSEWEEWFQLVQAEEKLRLLRIQILGELAQLRGITLPEMAAELGIKAPGHAE